MNTDSAQIESREIAKTHHPWMMLAKEILCDSANSARKEKIKD